MLAVHIVFHMPKVTKPAALSVFLAISPTGCENNNSDHMEKIYLSLDINCT